MRILQIEDDTATSRMIELVLRAEGFNVYSTDTGEEGIDLAKAYEYDAILLDLNLPDLSGMDVLRALRAAKVETPVIVVTGSTGFDEEIASLKAGADDYVRKPFHRDVLVERLHAVCRRARGLASPQIVIGAITVNVSAKSVSVNGNAIHFTGSEYQMIELMALRQGMMLTKEVFLNHLYGGLDEPEPKIIDVFICKIRRKLARYGASEQIETVWARGHRLVAEPTNHSQYALRRNDPDVLTMKGQMLAQLGRGDASVAAMQSLNRHWSQASVRATLSTLQQEGYVKNVGSRGAAVYRLVPAGGALST